MINCWERATAAAASRNPGVGEKGVMAFDFNLPANSSNPGINLVPERSAVWFDRGIDMKRCFPFALHLRKGRAFSPDSLSVQGVPAQRAHCALHCPIRKRLCPAGAQIAEKTAAGKKNRRCEMQNGQKEDENDNFLTCHSFDEI